MYPGGERQSATSRCCVLLYNHFCPQFVLNENLNEISILCHVLLFYDDFIFKMIHVK
jgi:hypothetical protein